MERFDKDNTCKNPDVSVVDRCANHNLGVTECPDHLGSEELKGTPTIPTCAIRPIWPKIRYTQDSGDTMGYDHDLLPNEDHLIQKNKHAVGTFQTYHVEWSWDDDIDPESPLATQSLKEAGRGTGTGNGEFLRTLKLGDMITVWGHARFPGWTNNIQRVEVKVYWAF